MKDNKEFYEFLDNKEIKMLNKINVLVELSKKQYKDRLVEVVKKNQFTGNNFIISNDKFKSIAAELFGSIEELNVIAYQDIGKYYYDLGIKQVKDLFEKEAKEVIEKEYTPEVFETILDGFILGNGLDFNYKQELERRMNYFNDRMANATMAAVNKKIANMSKEKIEKDFATIASGISSNNVDVTKTVKSQKRGISKVTDAVGTYIATKSLRKAYEDNGIEYVVRHAEVDGHTCEYCLERDGKTFRLDDVDIPSHYSCRCWVEPLDEKDK